jgi:hypothetical protein
VIGYGVLTFKNCGCISQVPVTAADDSFPRPPVSKLTDEVGSGLSPYKIVPASKSAIWRQSAECNFQFVPLVRSCRNHDMPLLFWQFMVAVHGCVENRASICDCDSCSGESVVQYSALNWLQEMGLRSKPNLLRIQRVVNFSCCQVSLQIQY